MFFRQWRSLALKRFGIYWQGTLPWVHLLVGIRVCIFGPSLIIILETMFQNGIINEISKQPIFNKKWQFYQQEILQKHQIKVSRVKVVQNKESIKKELRILIPQLFFQIYFQPSYHTISNYNWVLKTCPSKSFYSCKDLQQSQNIDFKHKSKMEFIEIFQEKIYNQYLIIGVAVLIVVVIKVWMANKEYKNKLASFIHPDSVLPNIKEKVKSLQDAQNLLAFNLHKLTQENDRLRNIAFLMALIKSYGVPLQPLKQKVEQIFTKLNLQTLSKANKTYREYILNQVQGISNTSNKKQKPFYTI